MYYTYIPNISVSNIQISGHQNEFHLSISQIAVPTSNRTCYISILFVRLPMSLLRNMTREYKRNEAYTL